MIPLQIASGVLIFLLIGVAFSWLGWRVLHRWGPPALFAFAGATTLLYSALATFRLSANQAAAGHPARPGVLSTNFVIFVVLAGASFAGASVGLWRHSRSNATPHRPLRSGMAGFLLGLAVPLVYAFGQDVYRLMDR